MATDDAVLERAREAARALRKGATCTHRRDSENWRCDRCVAAAFLRFAADAIELPGHGADEGCIAHAIRLRQLAERNKTSTP